MSFGKTKYTLQFYTYPDRVNQIVFDWLQQSLFRQDYSGDNTWSGSSFDPTKGNRGFQYGISGNTLTIFAWITGPDNKIYTIDDSGIDNAVREEYKNLINGLFDKINEANAAYQQQLPNTYQQQNANTAQYYPLQYVPGIEDGKDKQKEKLCIIGFALSIAGLLLSFCGAYASIVFGCLDIYFAVQGWNTKKRGFAIATVVLTALSFLVMLFQVCLLILANMA